MGVSRGHVRNVLSRGPPVPARACQAYLTIILKRTERHTAAVTDGVDHARSPATCARLLPAGSWTDAYRALRLADEEAPLGAEILERLSTSAYMVGRDLEFEQFVVRRHRAHVDADEGERAARCAFWLGLALLFRGEVAQANAWIARGHRLIAGHDCVEARLPAAAARRAAAPSGTHG